MKRKMRLTAIAISLAVIMFTQSMPINILSTLAEEIIDGLTFEETIEREFYSGNMVDKYNIGTGEIVQENDVLGTGHIHKVHDVAVIVAVVDDVNVLVMVNKEGGKAVAERFLDQHHG